MDFKPRYSSILICLALALFGLALRTAPAQAAPAAPVDIPITQPDGSTFTARVWGDEHQHGMETHEGYTILKDEQSGYWVYAAAQDGTLAPARSTGQLLLVVGRDSPAALGKHVRPAAPVEEDKNMTLSPALARASQAPNIGEQPLLVIFVNFSNLKRTSSITDLTDKLFGLSGSVKDFYTKASFGKLTIIPAEESYETTNDGIVEVTLDYDHPGNGFYDTEMIAKAALEKADPHVLFSNFDDDSDATIISSELHLLFIIAGYEEAYCHGFCSQNATWAHHITLSVPVTVESNTKIGGNNADGDMGGYSMVGELHGLGGATNHAATIGVITHELGHDLTWPDLYDTDTTSEGAGNWSLMGSGSWNKTLFDGDSPALPDAWAKWYQGWLSPQEMTNGTHALLQASQNPSALLLGSNPAGVDWNFTKSSGTGEYWLLENRQQDGYDAGLPGCGILIWHIDESVTYTNEANQNEDDPLIRLVQADGKRHLYHKTNRGDAGDPFPGRTSNAHFSPWGSPKSTYYSGVSNGKSVTVTTTICAASMSVSTQDFTDSTQDDRLYLPTAFNAKEFTGKMTYKGIPMGGRTLTLYANYEAKRYYSYAETKTDINGNYRFSDLPSLNEYIGYMVTWSSQGDSFNDAYLAFWDCEPVYGIPGDDLTCNIEISNPALAAPAEGSSISLPYTFRWTMRSVASERYAVIFMNPEDHGANWLYKFPVRTSSWTMTELPAAMVTNTRYIWDVVIYGENGVGGTFDIHYRSVYFNDRSSPPLESAPASTANWTTHPPRRAE